MGKHETETLRAWVEVDLGALAQNYKTLLNRAKPRVGVMPVVKADAYGLGLGPVVRALETMGPWGYGVAAVSEGIQLRQMGVERPILLLFCTPEELDPAAEARVTPAIGDLEALERWRAIARSRGERLPFHLEVDTGMGRAGFHFAAADHWVPQVSEASERDVEWQGTFTHYHSADAPDEAPTAEQWERFQSCMARLPEGVGGLIHTAPSAVAYRWPGYSADLVRPGLFLYGAFVSDAPPAPEPVVAVRARVTSVRDVPAGWTVSYGATYQAPRPSRWATLAIGYGDGLRRELTNNGVVQFGDAEAPIIGRVCMDVTIVDTTEMKAVGPGDVATLIGGAEGPTSLGSVAARCGTIPYELLTGLTQRLPRVYAGAPKR